MIPYQTKSKKISGTSYGEVMHGAMAVFDEIKKKTKRRPYIRSAYFKKEKIFLDYFREHLFQKSVKDRMQRLKYFKATCELIKYSKTGPIEKTELFEKKEILYRFAGLTMEKELFYVQIKEDKKRKRKYLMSCFPPG
ncbi:MAG: hypothetical protein A2271_03170 [Candidatus Moranbacteria bacterium RIFOXYA12_FULL_35_19]|nr:MAG: hypothetical protein UR78_C0010G0030 [Candidatus Moranbacteria bacterium GW2011_GWF2_35_39]OGI30896.1 MAG: hypothetical protein A2343_02125 [Candidatus Moranbacteria bacterium RIFOXYB12_FULL_35_8]OGI32315.1 MAG: hypothetical protein A2489_03175 [Candidatus Moranbacteria bacterium RIFOXYC12_FULL_36_13]OGI36575.1 MAG: hypothetical protein A2271_03170 [Candidatus Moranbacteria bacterium RIFOXYA12_FULL_35_19]